MAPVPTAPTNKTPDSVKNLIAAGFQTYSIVSFAAKINVPSADVLKYTQDTTVSQTVDNALRQPNNA